ncbi:MAG: hypothetical protein DLM50_07455 [Candidatus Meridianibacter frigidus]|nr:MAG: hypothetical protein DLM50_07455 [Candidatus Eremiobacteraeota bacterium]
MRVVERWRRLRSANVVRLREVACVGAPRTLLLAECGESGRPVVALTAGVHGDEPAAVWAVLSMVEDGLLDPRFAYRIWPCTNPTGFEAGTRENLEGTDINRSFGRGGMSPESAAILTSNRDRQFALTIDCHEDPQATGFYCYELERWVPGVGRRIVDVLDMCGLPVESLNGDLDIGYPSDDAVRRIERGRIVPDYERARAHFSGLTYSLSVGARAARRALTLEAPGARAMDLRIATLRVAVVAAVSALLDEEGRSHGAAR